MCVHYHETAKKGTPDMVDANNKPPMICTNAKTVTPANAKAVAIRLEPRLLPSKKTKSFCDKGDVAKAPIIRNGVVEASTAKKPPSTARKGFHWPAQSGLNPVLKEKVYQARENADIKVVLLRRTHDKKAEKPFSAICCFKERPSFLGGFNLLQIDIPLGDETRVVARLEGVASVAGVTAAFRLVKFVVMAPPRSITFVSRNAVLEGDDDVAKAVTESALTTI